MLRHGRLVFLGQAGVNVVALVQRGIVLILVHNIPKGFDGGHKVLHRVGALRALSGSGALPRLLGLRLSGRSSRGGRLRLPRLLWLSRVNHRA